MPDQRGEESVLETTYFGRLFSASPTGFPGSMPAPPGAGDDLVGPPSQQEGGGALPLVGTSIRR